MHELETAILNQFKNHPNSEFSTNSLVAELFKQNLGPIFPETNKQDKLAAKKVKAQLHRKLLYHLNKLVVEGILKITKVKAKGEKCFALAMEEGELIVGKRNKKIIITKTAGQVTPIEGYVEQKIVGRFGRSEWASQINSLLLEANRFEDLDELYSTIVECFSNVNDVIAVNNFGKLIQRVRREEIVDFLKKVDSETKNYSNRLGLIIDLINIENTNQITQFVEAYALFKPVKVDTIFNVDKKTLNTHGKFFEQVVSTYSSRTIKIYVKNNDLAKSSFFVGDTGVYNFDEEDWKLFLESKSKGVACSQAALVIDNKRFFQLYKTQSEYRKMLLTALKSLVLVNGQQRRKTSEYFRHILNLNKEKPLEIFMISRNYIRFWNYDLDTYKESTIDLLKSCKELTEEFCNTQETIFKSCGMPSRFRVTFSSSFQKFDQNLTDRIYRKNTISNVSDFFTDEMKKNMSLREDLFDLFEGADRVRFFRSGEMKPEDMVREISTILTSFTFPFFCYDFARLQGTVKLTQFMD